VNYGQHLQNRGRQNVFPAITDLSYCDPPLIYHPSDGGSILVFELWSGRLLKSMVGHFSKVSCLALRPKYEELYSSGTDSEILVWEPTSHMGIKKLEPQKIQ
ncbi:DNA excision repair protein ERCC-8, partial [Nowakowskiella sp. JEL0078]